MNPEKWEKKLTKKTPEQFMRSGYYGSLTSWKVGQVCENLHIMF